MSATIQVVFHLSGPLAGKTIKLGRKKEYVFVDGKMEAQLTPPEMALVARFLQRNWQAYPAGHAALKGKKGGKRNLSKGKKSDTKSEVSSDVQSDREGAASSDADDSSEIATDTETGDSGIFSTGDGSSPELNQKLLRAVQSLDQSNDDHWTRSGKPDISAVAKFYGATDVTRSDIEDVAPGFLRGTE